MRQFIFIALSITSVALVYFYASKKSRRMVVNRKSRIALVLVFSIFAALFALAAIGSSISLKLF